MTQMEWVLLRRTYQCLARGLPAPISLEQIEAVNRLVNALTDEAGLE
jgi:hypothetical protein